MSDALSNEPELISIERDGAVATLTIQRADKMNALNAEVLTGLHAAFDSLGSDVRCAILTGAGKAFVAGADIAAMAAMTPVQARAFSQLGHRLCASMERASFPIIAAVNGFALGGGLELALACDFIYASEKAKLGQPEVSLAVIPGFGGTQRLMRRVGIGQARELILAGGMIRSDEALRIGLVNKCFAPEALMAATMKTAQTIAAAGPLAVAAAKRVMLQGEGAALEAANELEAQAFAGLFGSQDQQRGMQAFLAKEKAEFIGS